MSTTTRGVLYIHSAPSAVCPHIEWAVGGVLGARMQLDWIRQPIEVGSYRSEVSWQHEPGTGAKLASALRGWEALRFEVTEDPSVGNEGARFSYTPQLGIFHAPIGVHGDIMIPEDRIRASLVRAARGECDLDESLINILGQEWDDELEPFRHAGDGVPVRWLHQVI